MKTLLFLFFGLTSTIVFSQNFGNISGKLIDFEENNQPLIFAKILVKETGNQTFTDEDGTFKIQNIEEGKYTLVVSFTGYETREIVVEIENQKTTNVKSYLKASSIDLNEIMAVLTSAENKKEGLTTAK